MKQYERLSLTNLLQAIKETKVEGRCSVLPCSIRSSGQ